MPSRPRHAACRALALAFALALAPAAPRLALAAAPDQPAASDEHGQDDRGTDGVTRQNADETSDKKRKPEAPTVEKEVSTDGETWSDAVDAPSFAKVSYRVTGTLPRYGEAPDECPYAFVDTFEPGIGVDASTVRVSLLRDGVASDVTGAFQVGVEGRVLTVYCPDLKAAIDGLLPTDRFAMTYGAAIGARPDKGLSNPNENAAKIRYRAEGGQQSETPEDVAFVYSYEVVLVKDAEDSASPLPGARFALRDGMGRWLADDGWTSDESARKTLATDKEGRLGFEALGCGTYELVEVAAPEGYGAIGPVRVTMTRTGGTDGGARALKAAVEGAELVSVDPARGAVTVAAADPRTSVPDKTPQRVSTTQAAAAATPTTPTAATQTSRGVLAKMGDGQTHPPAIIAAAGVVTLLAAGCAERRD